MRNELLRFLVGGTLMLMAMFCWTMVYPLVWYVRQVSLSLPMPLRTWKQDMSGIANYFFPAA